MFAWGNPSRGDDGVGPWFAERFRPLEDEGFSLVEDFQLQVEHLLDCRAGELLLLVDAGCHGGDDFLFEEIVADSGVAHTSHALAPAELLGHYRRVFAEAPPPAFQLVVPGESFELGQAMSAATDACCRRAARFVEQLLSRPDHNAWRALARSQSAPDPDS
jgi:hydrogenase maturation protease